MTIGEKIRKAREDAKLTQEELGKKIGVTAMGISYMEKGQRKIKIDDIVKITEQLGIDKTYLLEPITGSTTQNNDVSVFNFRSEFEIGDNEKRETENKINDVFNNLFKD